MIPPAISSVFSEIDPPSNWADADWSRILLYYYQDVWQGKQMLSENEKEIAHDDIQKLSEGTPLAYVTGVAHFYGRKFDVKPGVLIPRPETEELVEWVLASAQNGSQILDIGCGSGCIAVTLKAERNGLKVTAADVSSMALEVTAENAKKLDTVIDVREFDILNSEKYSVGKNWDVIVSNPPYVLPDEVSESIKYEPELALLSPEDDPLFFYRHIESHARINLKVGGRIFLEVSEFYADDTLRLFQTSYWSDGEIRRDLQGKKRMMTAVKVS
jgi:release factor glutamine methyltransferase